MVPQAAGFTLERGSLEASSHAAWLLDPAVPEDVLVARGLMARVLNARERYGVDENETVRDQTLQNVDAIGHSRGLKVKSDRGYPCKIGNVGKIITTEICGEALSKIHSPGRDYRWVYKFLSGYAHGLGYALALNLAGWQTVGKLRLGAVAPPVESVLLCGVATARVHQHAVAMLGHHAGLEDLPESIDKRTGTAWF